jgi:hypothetical protein
VRCIYKQTPEEEGLFKFHAKRSHAPSLSSGPLQTWIKTSESARSSQPDSWTIHDPKRAEKVRTVDSMVTGSGFQWAKAAVFFAGQGDRQTGHYPTFLRLCGPRTDANIRVGLSYIRAQSPTTTHLVCSLHIRCVQYTEEKNLFQPARIQSNWLACGNFFAGFPEIPSHYMVL